MSLMNPLKPFRYFNPLILCLALSMTGASQADDAAKPGQLSGGIQYETPEWFKDSFLDIQDDVAEAAAEQKHVMLFFHLNNCPYCQRMLHDGFEQEPLKSYIQQHFDTIGINIKGDREVAFNPETSVLEKELAKQLKVQYTPTIVFLDDKNNAVVRLNGYRSPARFKQVLEYVNSKAYAKGSLADYVAEHQDNTAYTLRDNPLFKDIKDLSSVKEPLAVIFEDTGCDECSAFHDKLLTRPDVQEELKALTLVRLDAGSDAEITDTEGNKTTPKDWAKKLEMLYRPGVVLFDQGKEVQRIDGMLFSFHFKEIFRYVAGGFYKTQGMHEYLGARQKELLASGVNINMAE